MRISGFKIAAICLMLSVMVGCGSRPDGDGLFENFSSHLEEQAITQIQKQNPELFRGGKVPPQFVVGMSDEAARLQAEIFQNYGVLCTGDGDGFTAAELKQVVQVLSVMPKVAQMGFLKVIYKSKISNAFNQAKYVEKQQSVIVRTAEEIVGTAEYFALLLHESAHAMQAAAPTLRNQLALDLGWKKVRDGFHYHYAGEEFELSEADIAFGVDENLKPDRRLFPSRYSILGPDEMISELVVIHVVEARGLQAPTRFHFSAYRESPFRSLISAYLRLFA